METFPCKKTRPPWYIKETRESAHIVTGEESCDCGQIPYQNIEDINVQRFQYPKFKINLWRDNSLIYEHIRSGHDDAWLKTKEDTDSFWRTGDTKILQQ